MLSPNKHFMADFVHFQLACKSLSTAKAALLLLTTPNLINFFCLPINSCLLKQSFRFANDWQGGFEKNSPHILSPRSVETMKVMKITKTEQYIIMEICFEIIPSKRERVFGGLLCTQSYCQLSHEASNEAKTSLICAFKIQQFITNLLNWFFIFAGFPSDSSFHF